MLKSRSSTYLGAALAVVLVILAAGCASQRAVNEADAAMKVENWDGAVYYYLEALSRDPGNPKLKVQLMKARQKAAQEHFKRGMALKEIGQLLTSRNELQMAVQLDPTHEFAAQELRKVDKELEILSQPEGAESLEEIKARAEGAKVQPPLLNPKSDEPITLSFPKPKPVKEIYRALGKAYGFNVLFDTKLKNDKMSVELRDVTAKQALEIVMQGAGHFYKVLDENTIIVVEDTPQNRRDYEDLVIKTFFLSNAEVKDVDKMLRSLIEARRLATNEQLNAITVRDTADKVAIAEKLIKVNDKAKAEVMIDVELLEVNSTKLQELGVKLSTQSFLLALNDDVRDENGRVPLDQIKNISRGDWSITVPNVLINLVKSSSDATSLAQPKMRITEGEKGQLHIGTRTPIPTTTFNTANTIGGNVVPITSYQYQDVGIKIEVEPRVHHNREITLKVTVEVSNIAGYNDDGQPIIGTRTINTVIRLQDGETNMLVGLYAEDDSSTKTKIPLLSDIPGLGRLFTNDSTKHQTADLVLTLTPHIIRFPDIELEDLEPLWVGTEKRISYFGNSPRVRSGKGIAGPFDAGTTRERRSPRTSRTSRTSRSSGSGSTSRTSRGGSSGAKPGVSLVPDSGLNKQDLDVRIAPIDGEGVVDDVPQIQLFLQPQIASLKVDERNVTQVALSGARGTYRVRLDVSFDPETVQLEGVLYPPGVVEMDRQRLDPDEGVLTLDLAVNHPDEAAQLLASLGFRALAPGASPLVVSVEEFIDGDGAEVPVAVGDGNIFILGEVEAAD